jgi:L-alanine-DL-glutamate epimerase-like enolase superfamily enzyme
MKIEHIEVLNLHFDYPGGTGFRYAGGTVTSRVTSLVRVHTDGPQVGIGAAYSHPDLVKLIVERHLGPHLLGRDPTEVEELWDLMHGLTRWYGRKGAAVSSLGGVDIAFWDLRGKALDKPVYELLGSERDYAPAYASGLFWTDELGELEAEAARHVEHGFRRVKMRLGRSPDYDLAAVEAAQRGVGEGGDVMVDGSHRYSPGRAEATGRELAARGVFWFEEPFPPEDLDAYVALRPKIDIPLAAGENDFGVQGFRELIRAGALDIVQPDCCRAGGITECLRIGRMAQEAGLSVATHTWSDAVALVANAHLVAALPNGITVEVDQTDNPFIDELLAEPLAIADGRLALGRRPGLGIELDEDVLSRLTAAYGEEMADGNYSDLIFGPQHYTVAPPFESEEVAEQR